MRFTQDDRPVRAIAEPFVHPARRRDKIEVRLEIGTHEPKVDPRPAPRAGEPLRLLFAARFLYWKGMHLGLKAVEPS